MNDIHLQQPISTQQSYRESPFYSCPTHSLRIEGGLARGCGALVASGEGTGKCWLSTDYANALSLCVP